MGKFLALLDGKKTYIAGLLVSGVTSIWPPAKDLAAANPELAVSLVSLLLCGLRSLSTEPGVVAKLTKKF